TSTGWLFCNEPLTKALLRTKNIIKFSFFVPSHSLSCLYSHAFIFIILVTPPTHHQSSSVPLSLSHWKKTQEEEESGEEEK
ncbi:unnamed protein product, partial [Linum tenue]